MLTRDNRLILRSLRRLRIKLVRTGVPKKPLPCARQKKNMSREEIADILITAGHSRLEKAINDVRRGDMREAAYYIGLWKGLEVGMEL